MLELSGPLCQLRSGRLIGTTCPFPMWGGSRPSGHNGVTLRSDDGGATWDDSGTFFRHESLSPLESRVCELSDGRLAAIAWAFDEAAGRSLPNHVTFSHDSGDTWTTPLDTNVQAQASNLLPLAGTRCLSVHAHREGSPIGVVVRVVDLADHGWRQLSELNVWSAAPPQTVSGFGDMGTSLKFGQPSLVALGGGEYLAYFWAMVGGKGSILAQRILVTDGGNEGALTTTPSSNAGAPAPILPGG